MTESTIVLSDSSSGEESNVITRPAFATKSTSSSEPKPRNIAVKKGAPPHIVNSHVKKKDLETLQTSSNFLDNFNPHNSRREKNKRRTQAQVQLKPQPKKVYNYIALYDEHGRLKSTGQDVCDCFEMSCVGCHFACYLCGSHKCGMRCRNNRKFMYEAIEHDGKDVVINNPLFAQLMN